MPSYCANFYAEKNCTKNVRQFGEKCQLCLCAEYNKAKVAASQSYSCASSNGSSSQENSRK